MSDERQLEAAPSNPFARKEGGALSTLQHAMSKREEAEIQSQLVIARRFPRDQVTAMDNILTDCTLPALAEAATYEYVRGGEKIGGATIRLAEAVARRWGNMRCGVKELSRDEGSSECMSYAWDLESGYYEERTFQVPHWRDTRGGGHPLTDERDIYELVANMGARRKRACILAVIPMDVFDRAVHACEVALKNKIVIDDEVLAGLLEKLGEFNITKEMVEKLLGRRYAKDTITPGMVLKLRKIYNSLYDKMSVVTDWFKADREVDGAAKTESGRRKPAKKKSAEPAGTLQRVEQGQGAPTEPETVMKLADASQLEFIRNKAKAGAITDAEICKAFKLLSLEELRAAVVPAVLRWLSDPTSSPT